MSVMSQVLLPAEDWDTINSLCFDRKVIQIGVAGGLETVTMARTARCLVVCPTPASADWDVDRARLQELYDAVTAGAVWPTVMVHGEPWVNVIHTYMQDQFDVAVINPEAFSGLPDQECIHAMTTVARNLIVVGRGGHDMFDAVASVCPRPNWSTTSSGRLTVARLMFPVTPDAEKEKE